MSDRLLVVFAYDTPDDRRRRRIARVLDDVGDRVQWSVFEAWLTQQQIDSTLLRLQRLLDAKSDKLRVYRLCAYCRAAARVAGSPGPTSLPEYWIV